MGEAIYEINGLELSTLKQESSLDQWFFEMVQKSVTALTIKDISHMLRQEVFLDIALSCAYEKILDNPFCGEMYDGQMFELLIRALNSNPQKRDMDFYMKFKDRVEEEFESYKWYTDDDRNYYKKLLAKFEELFE